LKVAAEIAVAVDIEAQKDHLAPKTSEEELRKEVIQGSMDSSLSVLLSYTRPGALLRKRDFIHKRSGPV
jgi:hypothetical protein